TRRPHARAHRRRPDRRISSLAIYFLRQHSHRPRRPIHGLPAPPRLPRTEHSPSRLDRPGPLRFRRRPPFLRPRSIRRTHHRRARDSGAAGARRRAPHRLRIPRDPSHVSFIAHGPVSSPHFPRVGRRQLRHPPRHRWHPVSISTFVSGWNGFHANSVRLAHDAPSHCLDEPEDDHAANPRALRIPWSAGLQHHHHRPVHHAFCHHRQRHAGLADRNRSIQLRIFHLAAIHQHEHAGLRRSLRRAGQQRQHPRHPHEPYGRRFRRRGSLARNRILHSRSRSRQHHPIHSRRSPRIFCAWRDDAAFHHRLPRIESRRWRHGKSTQRNTRRIAL